MGVGLFWALKREIKALDPPSRLLFVCDSKISTSLDSFSMAAQQISDACRIWSGPMIGSLQPVSHGKHPNLLSTVQSAVRFLCDTAYGTTEIRLQKVSRNLRFEFLCTRPTSSVWPITKHHSVPKLGWHKIPHTQTHSPLTELCL